MSRIDKKPKPDEGEIFFPHASINRKPWGDTFHAKNKLLGGYMDRKLVDLASLYCVYTGVSKTDLLTELVKNKSKDFPTEKQMMEGICKQQLDNWIGYLESLDFEQDIQYQYRKKKVWEEYKKGLKKEMNKIVPKYYTNYVIDYIESAQF